MAVAEMFAAPSPKASPMLTSAAPPRGFGQGMQQIPQQGVSQGGHAQQQGVLHTGVSTQMMQQSAGGRGMQMTQQRGGEMQHGAAIQQRTPSGNYGKMVTPTANNPAANTTFSRGGPNDFFATTPTANATRINCRWVVPMTFLLPLPLQTLVVPMAFLALLPVP